MDCLKWQVMSGWSYVLSLLLPKPREATCDCCLQHYSGYRLCTRHTPHKQTQDITRNNGLYCSRALCWGMKFIQSYKSASQLDRMWVGFPAGRVGVAVLAAWGISSPPRSRQEKTCRSGTDWAAGLGVRRPCQADGWQYTLLSPACPRLHTPTLYQHFLNTVRRAKVEGDGRKRMTLLSLMHLFCVFPLAFLSSSDKVHPYEANRSWTRGHLVRSIYSVEINE